MKLRVARRGSEVALVATAGPRLRSLGRDLARIWTVRGPHFDVRFKPWRRGSRAAAKVSLALMEREYDAHFEEMVVRGELMLLYGIEPPMDRRITRADVGRILDEAGVRTEPPEPSGNFYVYREPPK